MESNTHINAVHRSNYRDFLVTGDSNGRVRLYKYPSITTKVLLLYNNGMR
jgi:hypothetical protein